MPRPILAIAPALGIALVSIGTRPLGPLAGTMLLVIVLPQLAVSLEALGWADIVVGLIQRARLSAARRLLVAYGSWLAVSAVLTLDVAAVVAVPIGLRLGDERGDVGRRDHLAAAILGSNVGSLLFPFSNLTNLIVVAATATPFAAYVAAAWAPQVVAAVAVAVVLIARTRHRTRATTGRLARIEPAERPGRLALFAGATTSAGAVFAVVIGLAGGDVAPIFAVVTAIVSGCALISARERLGLARLLGSIPPSGVAIVLIASLASGSMIGLAGRLPDPQAILPAVIALPALALVGGLLAATINNLPAAAFGAVWLVGGSPDAVVAYLIGTNLLAIASPHGSLATILCTRVAAREGIAIGFRTYLRTAWRYAGAAAAAAVIVLIIDH